MEALNHTRTQIKSKKQQLKQQARPCTNYISKLIKSDLECDKQKFTQPLLQLLP